MFHKLPPELFQIILEYASVKYRNGEYISRIEKTDARYDLLKTIPPILLAKDDIFEPSKYYSVKLSQDVYISYYSSEYDDDRYGYYVYVFHNDVMIQRDPDGIMIQRDPDGIEKKRDGYLFLILLIIYEICLILYWTTYVYFWFYRDDLNKN